MKMDKIDRLLDAIEHADSYSAQELNDMLADPEVFAVYNLLNKTKSGMTPIKAPDVDSEWKEFERSHPKRRFSILNLFSRNIAAGVAIAIASLAAVAAVVSVNFGLVNTKHHAVTESVSATEDNVVTPTDSIIIEDAHAVATETIVFDNERFDSIVNRIAEYYGCKTEFSNNAPKSLRLYFRWNQALSLEEVVEALNNFEQINLTTNDKVIKID